MTDSPDTTSTSAIILRLTIALATLRLARAMT
jgi:hypothetical protein